MAIGAQISQYFKIVVSSPPETPAGTQKVSLDVTKYIDTNVKLLDEDGLVQELSFDLTLGYTLIDVLALGMRVDMIGGDLTTSENLFIGYIKNIVPKFSEGADLVLSITCYSEEGKTLGTKVRDILHPNPKHPQPWGRKALTYSAIILNICKDSHYKVGEFKVLKDIDANFKKSVRQHNQTDFAFIQFLALKINCTVWVSILGGENYINVVDNSLIINKLADHTFYYLARLSANEFVPISTGSNKIVFYSCEINLDTRHATVGRIKQSTNKKGETEVTFEGKNEKGQDTNENTGGKWVLDEAKLRALSDDERNDIIQLFLSGKVTWDGDNGTVAAKNYFTWQKYDVSSREGQSKNSEIQTLKGAVKDDGYTGKDSTTTTTGGKSFKTVIDTDKIKQMSPEQRSGILGRIARGEMTEADKQYYTVVDTTPAAEATVKKTKDSQQVPEKEELSKKEKAALKRAARKAAAEARYKDMHDKDRQKRDEGFTIVAKVLGDLAIVTKLSYVLEGLSKYSGDYYLYKIAYEWGVNGFWMTLTFVK